MPDNKHAQPVADITRAITQLYLQNMRMGQARWLYEKWTDFTASVAYRATPDTLLFPVLSMFANLYAQTRQLAPNKGQTPTQVEVSVLELVSDDMHDTWEGAKDALVTSVTEVTDAAVNVAKRASRGMVWPIGIAIMLGGVALTISIVRDRGGR